MNSTPTTVPRSISDTFVTALSADKDAAQVTVKNSGADTEDVIELYIRDEASPFAPTNPVLCGFMSVKLGAGEEKTLCIDIDPNAFTVVNDCGERIPGSGSWTLYAGTSQPDERSLELTGKRPASCTVTR